jgi:cytochrome b-561
MVPGRAVGRSSAWDGGGGGGDGGNGGGAAPAHWAVGPPAPRAVGLAVRALQAAILAAVLACVFGVWGGLALAPTAADAATGANATGRIFNWHPLLMALAFPLLMGEALLAYRSPLPALDDRAARKAWHAALHAGAAAAAALGLAAAFASHSKKRPDPIPHLYSPHSILGLTVAALMAAQFAVGAAAFLAPRWSAPRRAALAPIHAFFGLATFFGGLAAMAAGLQEKATFSQAFGGAGVRSAALRLPALLQVLLLALALAVGYHFAPSAPERQAAAARRGGGEVLEGVPLQVA